MSYPCTSCGTLGRILWAIPGKKNKENFLTLPCWKCKGTGLLSNILSIDKDFKTS